MLRRAACLFLVLVLIACDKPVRAAIIYQTGFEGPKFLANQPLAGQDSWDNQFYDGSYLGPNAFVSLVHPSTGLQSLEVRGGDLTTLSSGYAVGSYRRYVDYDVASSPLSTIRISVDARIDGPPTEATPDFVTGDFMSANLVGFTDAGEVGEMYLSSDGHIYGTSVNGGYLFAYPAELGQYHTMRMDFDFAERTASYFVNGDRLGTEPFDPLNVSTVFSRGSLLSLVLDPDTLNRDRFHYAARFDNFSIKAVPEPNSAILGCIAVGSISGVVTGRRILRKLSSRVLPKVQFGPKKSSTFYRPLNSLAHPIQQRKGFWRGAPIAFGLGATRARNSAPSSIL